MGVSRSAALHASSFRLLSSFFFFFCLLRRARGHSARAPRRWPIAAEAVRLSVEAGLRKSRFFVALFGCALVASVEASCSDSNPDGGAINLPPRRGEITDGSTPASCANLSTKVSDRPSCDKCAKDKCCTEIQACNASSDCAALQECLAPCAQADTLCILTCQEGHPKGGDLLQEVGSCAQMKCKSECPSETPDADPFADF